MVLSDADFLNDRDCEPKDPCDATKIEPEKAEPVAWQERTYSEEDKAWSNWYHIDNESLLIRKRYPRSWVELRPLYAHPPEALSIDHQERIGALGALNALFAENELPMSDRNGVLYDTIKNALAELSRNEALNNAMKITEELDRRREERLRRLRLHEAIELELTDEQCDDVILRVGLWHLAEAKSRNRATLRWLCREAVAAARGSK